MKNNVELSHHWLFCQMLHGHSNTFLERNCPGKKLFWKETVLHYMCWASPLVLWSPWQAVKHKAFWDFCLRFTLTQYLLTNRTTDSFTRHHLSNCFSSSASAKALSASSWVGSLPWLCRLLRKEVPPTSQRGQQVVGLREQELVWLPVTSLECFSAHRQVWLVVHTMTLKVDEHKEV